MFLRSPKRKKNGKWHEYFSVVENRRVAVDKTVQRTVLYLGEITSSQENRSRKTQEVFDEDSGRYEQEMLFADHARIISESDIDSIKVKLSQMRNEKIQYLVGTPRAMLARLEDKLVDMDWKAANENVSVKLMAEDNELYVPAKSKDRRAKERAMRKYRLRKYLAGLEKLRKHCRNRDKLIERLGALKQQAGRSSGCVDLTIPQTQTFAVGSFTYELNRAAYRKMLLRDGMYLLRTNLTETDPDMMWQRYILLTQVEAAFRSLKSDLAVRPVRHQLEHRVEAHIFVAVMGYCLMVTLRQKLRGCADGLTAQDVLDKLGSIMMMDVRIPTADGRMLEMRRYSQPEQEHQIIVDKLRMTLPKQPPPKIYSRQLNTTNDMVCGGN